MNDFCFSSLLENQPWLSDCLQRSPPEQFATGPWTSVSQGSAMQQSLSLSLGCILLLYPPSKDSGLLL